MNDLKLVIFDCDGTLIDSEVIACEFFPNYWKTHGVEMSVNEFKETFIGVGNDSDVGRAVFSRMPDYAEEEGDRLYAEALDKELQSIDGIPKLLERLSSVNICVASNSSIKHVQNSLLKTDLSIYFKNQIFSAEMVEKPKPSPDLFSHVAKTLGYDNSECVVVEDSPAGVIAAKAAGMKVISFSGAQHFTSKLEDRLKTKAADWHCNSVESLSTKLVSLMINKEPI